MATICRRPRARRSRKARKRKYGLFERRTRTRKARRTRKALAVRTGQHRGAIARKR